MVNKDAFEAAKQRFNKMPRQFVVVKDWTFEQKNDSCRCYELPKDSNFKANDFEIVLVEKEFYDKAKALLSKHVTLSRLNEKDRKEVESFLKVEDVL